MRQHRGHLAGWLAVVALFCLPVLAGCGKSAYFGSSQDTPAATGDVSTAAHTTFTMPRLVGLTLPAAKAAIATSARNALLAVSSKDATGRDRPQTTPAQWKVCTQSARAGDVVDQTTTFVLSVVKTSETCPAE